MQRQKGKGKGNKSENLHMVWFKSEQVRGDGLEQFLEHTDKNTEREREREGGHSCLPFDKARHRVFI